jgi:WD40 repeat protein
MEIASGGIDRTVKIMEPNTGVELRVLSVGNAVNAIAFSPDSASLAVVSGSGPLELWEPLAGTSQTLQDRRGISVRSVDFSPLGLEVVSGSQDTTVKLWDAKTGDLIGTLGGANILAVAWSADGQYVAFGDTEGNIKILDQSLKIVVVSQAHQGQVISLAFSPDGQRIASGSDDKTVKLWDRLSGNLIWSVAIGNSVTSVIFSPDNRYVGSGTSGTSKNTKLWDVATGALTSEFEGEFFGVNALAVSPNGQYIASGSWLHSSLWEVTTH